MACDDSTGHRTIEAGIIDTMTQFHPPDLQSVPIPLEALRDEPSRQAWPGLGVVEHLFDKPQDRGAQASDAGSIVAEFDRWGINQGMITVNADQVETVVHLLGAHIDRFLVAVRLDPHRGMETVRALERAVRSHPELVRAAAITPHSAYPAVRPDTRECYPIYVKCIELGIPIFITVGFPGPRVPAQSQDPMALDEVCWFFPELVVVMRHGGQPWFNVCEALLRKWPNLYYSTSAFTPRRYPSEILRLLRGRHNNKVLFGGYWPTLSYERVLAELTALELTEAQEAAFLRENAQHVLRL